MKVMEKLQKTILPLLAILNAGDAILSFMLFQSFGVEIEKNPLILALLRVDTSAWSFLMIKLAFSIFLVWYWKTAIRVRRGINVLAFLGVVVYSTYFAVEIGSMISLYFI